MYCGFHSDIYKIRFLADPALDFTNAADVAFTAAAVFGGPRSKRYALLVEDGKVKDAFIEPDNTGLNSQSDSLSCRRVTDGLMQFPLPTKFFNEQNTPRSRSSRSTFH